MHPLFTADETTMQVLGICFVAFSLHEIGMSGDQRLDEERRESLGLEG